MPLFYFCLVKFVCSLLSTFPDSNKVVDWEGDRRGSTIFWRKSQIVLLVFMVKIFFNN